MLIKEALVIKAAYPARRRDRHPQHKVPLKITFSHISKFQFVYVFIFLNDRPQYGGVHKDFQRVEVQTRFVASESNFPHSRRLCLNWYEVWW